MRKVVRLFLVSVRFITHIMLYPMVIQTKKQEETNMKAIKGRKSNQLRHQVCRYPNQAEPGYHLKKICEAVLTLISSAGIATLLLFFILL